MIAMNIFYCLLPWLGVVDVGRGMDGDDAVEEGADDAAAAGDVSAKAPRRPVRLRPHM